MCRRLCDRVECGRERERATETKHCPKCGHELMPPEPEGTPGDDSYYCEGCGRPWSLDLKRELL